MKRATAALILNNQKPRLKEWGFLFIRAACLLRRRCSTVVVRVIGNDEVGGPIPLNGTIFPYFLVLFSALLSKTYKNFIKTEYSA